jgi:SAM-dependent methyltransferase
MSAARSRKAKAPAVKRYDRDYFDRWYRDPRHVVVHSGVRARRVQLAVAAAEYLLEREVASVLDVGCGEALWRESLKRARPKLRYVGVDSSEYVVARFGRSRGIRLGTVGELASLKLGGPFDLIVCSDVLHYVDTVELKRGLRAIARLLGGVAFLELYTKEDATVGDDSGFQPRGEALYRRLFREAGLLPLGLHCYVGRALRDRLVSFERAGAAARSR